MRVGVLYQCLTSWRPVEVSEVLYKPSSLEDVYDSWASALSRKDFKQGLLVASEGYRLAIKKESSTDERMLLYLLKMAVEELLKDTPDREAVEQGDDVCSFCCLSTKGKKAVAGTSVLICDECIRKAFEVTYGA